MDTHVIGLGSPIATNMRKSTSQNNSKAIKLNLATIKNQDDGDESSSSVNMVDH